MAETLLSFGLHQLWALLVRESGRFKGVDEQLTELKSDLNLLRSFLKDADAKKHASALVRNCVEEINEIVFDTEDIIETFILKEELRKKNAIKKRMKRLSCILMDCNEIGSDMKSISKRISKVIRDMQSFGVQQIIVDGGQYSHPLQEIQREMRKTFPSNNENDLVGLEENVKKLVGYLVEEDNIQVVCITGMGGIGKTTLARQVFNHETVKDHFGGIAWVCISQQFTRKYVWETILQKLNSKHVEHRESNMTEDELQEKLFQLLETCNSLIVLDDMWREEDWDRIKPAFPSKKGWKVLLTSRNERVATRAYPTCVTVKLECLTIEESWTLFQRILFRRKDTTEFKVDKEVEDIGKQMIQHCGRLPLAVKVLGGLLAAQHSLSDWKRISENIRSHIVGGSSFSDINTSSIYHILYMSFEELPIYLKNCFLYLSHFPEDYAIDVEELAYYWASDGIQRPRYYERATIREVADGYIEELVKRNMVISKRDKLTSKFESCRMHDMMREVCLVKAEEENFVHIFDAANSQSPCNSRRIIVHQLDKAYHMVGEIKNPKLRSLLFIKQYSMIGWMAAGLSFTRLQLMRVLDLSYAKFKRNKLSSSIGKLIHLRYLSLYQVRVTHLPSSMRNLKMLLYLNLNVNYVIYMPNFLKEMRELRYLYLPWKIQDGTMVELGNLVNLETLYQFSTRDSSMRDLHRMKNLRSLSIDIRGERCSMETLSSAISELRHLENLTIVGGSTNDDEGFVLDCIHLKQLELSIYMPKLPDEQHFPYHLTTISLEECCLEEDPMAILEKLLELKEVRLWCQSFSGRRMVCSGGRFPQLEMLSISHLMEWEEWVVEEGSMPLLHSLYICDCKKLKELPDGLRFISSLKNLNMATSWKERLSEGGDDYFKIQHIPSVEFIRDDEH